MMGLKEDTPVVVEVEFHNHGVQQRGYRGGRAGHAKAMMGLKEDTPVVVEVEFHNHGVQQRGYRGGRAGHGSVENLFQWSCKFLSNSEL
ncbi:hypothetical protein GOBAR_AA13782 [Gossypium barbadense]|uniref:Uncharacterized protein n=1 Tax=Gossypium barbadense TaxID=3634 RepID=A0A2P5XUA1_GOSBA|nr:hypothetical protein GOBAR_AA13782 [Gossypium barbadense]